MTSNVITFKKGNSTIQSILEEAEKIAVGTGLQGKDILHLRLLTEEVCCMVEALVQNFEGEFWIDNDEKEYNLCLSINANSMSLELKEELLRTSSTGKNSAAKGFVGWIRDIVENFALVSDGYAMNMYGFETSPENLLYSSAWIYSQYKTDIANASNAIVWDELEKSILAKLANEVIVGIKGRKIEVVVKKIFK